MSANRVCPRDTLSHLYCFIALGLSNLPITGWFQVYCDFSFSLLHMLCVSLSQVFLCCWEMAMWCNRNERQREIAHMCSNNSVSARSRFKPDPAFPTFCFLLQKPKTSNKGIQRPSACVYKLVSARNCLHRSLLCSNNSIKQQQLVGTPVKENAFLCVHYCCSQINLPVKLTRWATSSGGEWCPAKGCLPRQITTWIGLSAE